MPKIIGESLAEHRVETRRRVLSAFGDLLTERGYDAVRLADVATRAEIGRTAIYNHFADKEAVLLAFAMEETERYVGAIRSALEDVADPVGRLRTYVRMHVALSREMHMGLGPQLYSVLSRDALLHMREHVIVVEDLLRDVLEDGMAQGAFVVDDLRATTGLVLACLQSRQVTHPEASERDAAVAVTERFVLRAVGVAA
ncbi:TetR/AcrR family transcriptional regulator [Mumia sp. zg.B21]|uniref:TetR/AcrR family transcriptional regulator n=1 Tax=unclassified Mumia TaxID=2621872 RepID=UPI001C6F3B4D|nr:MULTISPECIES: TetR/AcrR family transcriptional regulator [unclassified Mumia]MBW9209165.1 TetR/AcrR family transcriptional regulator [Mumia sp. zg.B21]MDD9347355.1 TetR/AcrR family transcriptional regulator [Mumia sp.]